MGTERKVAVSQNDEAGNEDNLYERLCSLAKMEPVEEHFQYEAFTDSHKMADASKSSRLTAGLHVFLELLTKSQKSGISRIDKALLDMYIGEIDDRISRQLDEVLHHEEFQKVESAWKSLKFLVDRCDFKQNVKVELLDLSKEDMREDFEEAPDTTQSGMYKHVYIQEYDTPGGQPVSAIISNYEFDSSAPDVSLLTEVSRIAASCHCPFIGAVGSRFFGKTDINELPKINDLSSYMEKAEFIR